MIARRLLPLACALFLASCGGGGGGSIAVAPVTSAPVSGGGPSNGPTTAPQSVHVNMHIPGTTTAAKTTLSRKSPQFVAASTEGVRVQVYATSDTAHATVIGTSLTDVTPGSTACGGANGARTCTINIPAPAGTDDFVFTTYNLPPNSTTTFPNNAAILASGSVIGQTIQSASANVVNVTLSGTLSYLLSQPFRYASAASVGAISYTLAIEGFDSNNDTILGPYVDANGNADPITVTEAETGGSGFTTIALNTGAPASSVVLSGSSDTVKVHYTGGGSIGYGVTFTGTTPTITSGGGVQYPTFAPLFVTSTSPAFTPGVPATLNLTSPNQQAVITLNELYGQNVGIFQTCGSAATVSAASGTGASQSFTITGASGGTCTVYVSFDSATYTINVTAPTNTSAQLTLPGTTLAYVPQGGGGVSIFNPSGTQLASISTATSSDGIGMDDAGDVYSITAPTNNNTTPASITEYVPGGTTYPPTYTASSRSFTPSNPDTTFFVQSSGAGELIALEQATGSPSTEVIDVWDPGKSGSPSRTITRTMANGSLIFGGIDHAGNIYIAYNVACGSGYFCMKYDVITASTGAIERTISESIVPQTNQTYFSPNYFAVAADGTFYVTEWSFFAPDTLAGVYIYPPSGPERYISLDVGSPDGIDLDANNDIYVVNNNTVYNTGTASADNDHLLTELSPSGDVQLKGIQLPPNPVSLTVGTQGNAWVSTFPNAALGEAGGLYHVFATAYTATQVSTVAANDIVLWNGLTTTESHSRSAASLGSASGSHGGFARQVR